MLTKLKTLFIRQAKNSDGDSLPDPTQKITECYCENDVGNRWQGDIYSKEGFTQTSLPNQKVPYWMLINRTCQLYTGEGRGVKLPFLNFITVIPLHDYIKSQDKNIKNAISDLVKGRLEGFQFLPAHPASGIENHLVANFNLIHTFKLSDTPDASVKLLQLSSPFCEHVFQRFSRYFYTVGFKDQDIKSPENIESIVSEYKEKMKQQGEK